MDEKNYERMVAEIQQLKKNLNAEKISHEATLKQLEASYDLNQQLQSINQTQAKNITSLNHQIAQKNSKLDQLGTVYENQILQLKELINAKDQELAGIRGSLMVTDYDMIRLRVINELELSHKEEIQEIASELRRTQKLFEDQKNGKELLEQKLQMLKSDLGRQTEQYERKLEEKDRKYHKQLNKMYDQVERQRTVRKDRERSIETANKKYSQMVEKYEADLAKAYEASSKPSTILSDQTSLSEKMYELRSELSRVQGDYETLRSRSEKQANKYQRRIHDLQNQISTKVPEGISHEQHLEKMKEKDSEIENLVKDYERKLKKLKIENQEEMKRLRSENDDLRLHPKHHEKYTTSKQNYSTHNLLEEGLLEIKRAYESRLSALQEQNNKLKQQSSDKDRQGKKLGKSSNNIQIYRAKLQEANRQIVNLLKEKVSLKQQINSLRKQ